ncbi:MAG: murein biosynthesis integral membrane protein MurJ [Dehalococcoidia bacterium]|nr:murein biosynthesis integral membrane protein MurJ [Dehalococcoidia bacterium]
MADEGRGPGVSAGRLGRFLADGGTRGVAGAAGIVALGFLGSRLLGLLRSVAIAHAFGTEPELAAYWVAFRLPDLVFQVLAGATLSAAFIPTFSRVALRGGDEASWRLASSVLNLIALATTLAAAVAFLLAPLLVPWLAPGLGAEGGDQERLRALAVDLTRLMLISPVLFGVSGMMTGILNARQRFLAPALAPLLYNASIIVGAVALAGPLGVRGLALAVVAGSAGHLLVQLPALRAAGMRWAPSFDLASEGVREVARLMGPRVLGLAAWQVNLVVVIFFASFVSDAAISAVNYAFMIAMLPVAVVGMAISTAVFPSLAQQAAARQFTALRQSLSASLRLILFLAVPASVGLIALARPAVRLLLERGAFDADATDLVVGATAVYAVGIFAHGGIEILSRGFYALADTRTPVLLAVLSMVVNVVLCALLVAPLGVRGLAAAASLSAVLEFALLLRALQHRLGGLDAPGLRRSAVRTLAATVLMAEALVLLLMLLAVAGVDDGAAAGALIYCVAGVAVGGATYTLAALALRSEEARLLARRLGR